MWRGTRWYFCILRKEPYLDQKEGRGPVASALLHALIHPSAWKGFSPKFAYRNLGALLLVLELLHLVVPEDARATILRYHLQGHVLWLPVAPEDRADDPPHFRLVAVAAHLDLLTHACLICDHVLSFPSSIRLSRT